VVRIGGQAEGTKSYTCRSLNGATDLQRDFMPLLGQCYAYAIWRLLIGFGI